MSYKRKIKCTVDTKSNLKDKRKGLLLSDARGKEICRYLNENDAIAGGLKDEQYMEKNLKFPKPNVDSSNHDLHQAYLFPWMEEGFKHIQEKLMQDDRVDDRLKKMLLMAMDANIEELEKRKLMIEIIMCIIKISHVPKENYDWNAEMGSQYTK